MTTTTLGIALALLISATAATAQVIAPDGGEARSINAGQLLLIKVDPVTVGATQFLAGSETLQPGKAIPVHRHANQEEILFIHRGTVTITLGEVTSDAVAGSMVFVPANAWIGVENRGQEPAVVVFVFPMVDMAGFFRRVAPRVGEAMTPISAEDREAIRQRYQIFPKAR